MAGIPVRPSIVDVVTRLTSVEGHDMRILAFCVPILGQLSGETGVKFYVGGCPACSLPTIPVIMFSEEEPAIDCPYCKGSVTMSRIEAYGPRAA